MDKPTSKNALLSHRILFLILLLATGLYCYQLGENGLWIDEFNSIYDAQRLPEGLGPTRPLYYILLRVWMTFGTSVEWLRGLSVIFGLGSIFLTYQLGSRIAGKPVGYVAAILLTCSPLVINHVQEVRMYSLSNFLGILGSLLLIEAIDKPTTVKIGKWATSRVLATLTTPLSILLLASDTMIIVWQLRHQLPVLRKMILGLSIAGISLVPTVLSMVLEAGPAFVSDWTADLPNPGLAAVVSKLTSFTAFWPLESIPKSLFIKALYYSYTLVLAVLMAIALFKIKKQSLLFATAAWALLPAAIMLLFSYLASPIWTGRYLLFLSPYVLILLAFGFTQVWHQSRYIAITAALLYVLAVGGGLRQYYCYWDRDDWKSAIEVIHSGERIGDEIAAYVPIANPKMAVEYYYKGTAPIHSIAQFQGSVNQAEIVRVLSDIPKSSERLWIIYRGINGNSKANDLVEQVIANQFQIQSHQQFDGPIDVLLVTRK